MSLTLTFIGTLEAIEEPLAYEPFDPSLDHSSTLLLNTAVTKPLNRCNHFQKETDFPIERPRGLDSPSGDAAPSSYELQKSPLALIPN